MPSPSQYRPELDVLRFFAATGVFCFHAFQGTNHRLTVVTDSGGYGVDLFFLLSSFLITTLLLRERDNLGFLDVKAFYLRRILRIWPLYFFFIGVAYLLTLVVPWQHLGGWYIAGFLLLAGNWVYVLRGVPQSVAGVLWSISVEEQFYLSWPQVVKRASARTIAALACGLLIAGWLTRLILVSHRADSDAFWFNTLVRLDPFALGILLALYMRNRDFVAGKVKRAGLFFFGAACWLLITHYGTLLYQSPLPGWKALVGYPVVSLGSAAFLVAAYNGPQVGVGFLADKRLAYFGKISYGIYVYHDLCIRTVQALLFNRFSAASVAAAAFVLTLLTAAASYQFLEKPFLRMKERFEHIRSRPT